jgi:hypothetical protein
MLTAHTEEADIFSQSIAELTEGFGGLSALKKNSVGLIHCHSDFIHTGAAEAIAKAFPFPIVGVSCSCQAADGFVSQMGLTLSILTSDECRFAVSLTDGDLTRYSMKELIPDAIKPLVDGELPKLIIPYFPFLFDTTAEYFLNVFDSLGLDIPLFGTLPISDEADFSDSHVIHNGVAYTKRAAFVAIYGDFSPKFAITSILDKSVLKTDDVITDSRRNIITTIADKPVIDYLAEKGVCDSNSFDKLIYQPFIFHTTDGVTLVRNFLRADMDKREIYLCGDAPLGSKLDFGLISSDTVIKTAEKLINDTKAEIGARPVLLYSCVSRYWALGLEWEAELKRISHILFGNKWSLAYSGGEIFPQNPEGKLKNTLQNNCLIFCMI